MNRITRAGSGAGPTWPRPRWPREMVRPPRRTAQAGRQQGMTLIRQATAPARSGQCAKSPVAMAAAERRASGDWSLVASRGRSTQQGFTTASFFPLYPSSVTRSLATRTVRRQRWGARHVGPADGWIDGRAGLARRSTRAVQWRDRAEKIAIQWLQEGVKLVSLRVGRGRPGFQTSTAATARPEVQQPSSVRLPSALAGE